MLELPAWVDRHAWPYVPKRVPVEAGALHLVDEGQGPQVVLVHGTPTWSFDWRHVIAGLRATQRVVAMDHLGFGLSARPPGADYSPEAHARRFRQAMAQVCPEGKVTLVVHDFGGPIALDWALANPGRLQSVVIVNSWMWSFADDPLMRRRAAMVDGWVGRWAYRHLNLSLRAIMPSAFANRRALTKALHHQYLSVFPDADSREQVLYALARALTHSAAFYDSLWARRAALSGVPMAILWGLADTAFTPPILKKWQQAYPHATVSSWPDAGHWPHEEKAEAFLSALRAHLAAPARG